MEDLIIHKIFAGRTRDVEDVQAVLLKNAAMDIAYIEKWLGDFDAVMEEKNFLATFREILSRPRQNVVQNKPGHRPA